MELSLLFWLLLPVAASSGWLAAKRSLSQQTENNARQLSSNYLQGINYLLNEQPDKAIDVFIKLIDVDSETVETHLALGVLFRRRGEVNRAIRIHQNLVVRSNLNAQQRELALLELAQDYQRAGLLDRAEHLFMELIENGQYQEFSCHQLLDIYQQEHDWDKAISIATRLMGFSGENMKPMIAQYYCEQAESARRQGELDTAHKMIHRALQVEPHCVRASLIEGQLALIACQLSQAIEAFQRVEQQDALFLSEVIEPLQNCYLGKGCLDEFKAYLQRILQEHGGITPMLVLARLIQEKENATTALNFVVKQLRARPSLRGLDHFIDMSLPDAQGVAKENLLLLKDITSQLLKNRPIYKCSECGFTGKTLHWQCPSCKLWNTVKPIQGLEGE